MRAWCSLPQVLLLENVRFYPEEEKNDAAFAQKVRSLAAVRACMHACSG